MVSERIQEHYHVTCRYCGSVPHYSITPNATIFDCTVGRFLKAKLRLPGRTLLAVVQIESSSATLSHALAIIIIAEKAYSIFFNSSKIIIIQKSDEFQDHIQFQSHQIAITIRNRLHGSNIYDGCCQLDIQFVYGDTKGKRTARVLKSDLKLEPKEDEIGPDLEQRKAEMGVELLPKVKQEICETTKVQESSVVTDLKVNMVINMYSKYGLDGYACKVFNGMPEVVVAGNMDVLEYACEFFSRHEADINELRTALVETKQMITWVEGVVVIGVDQEFINS
ncbi:hypothetical protein LguiB_028871 [Lonicera macranthoides]